MIKYVHCETQEEWDFAAKKLNRTCAVPYKECGDSICITNPEGSNFKSILTNGKMYSFQEWCDKFGHVNPFIIKETSKEEERLAYAKKHYPIGTKYHALDDSGNTNYGEGKITDTPSAGYSNNAIAGGYGYIYSGKTNTWAEIIKDTEEEKPQYIVSKWYTSKNWFPGSCCKFIGIDNNGDFEYSEKIYNGEYEDYGDIWSIVANIVEAPLELVQPFLPEGHDDKIIVKPEYTALPFPEEDYYKLKVIKDIPVSNPYIPKGSITWCCKNRYFKYTDVYLIEENRWEVNFPKEYFEIIEDEIPNIQPVIEETRSIKYGNGFTIGEKVMYQGEIHTVEAFCLQRTVLISGSKDYYHSGKSDPWLNEYGEDISYTRNGKNDKYWADFKSLSKLTTEDKVGELQKSLDIQSYGTIDPIEIRAKMEEIPIYNIGKQRLPDEVQLLQPKEDKRFNTSVNKIESVKIQLKQKSKTIKF